jgi:hypothetical protein
MASLSLSTPYLYLEQRAFSIVNTILEQSEIFGSGLTQILSHGSVPEADIERIVLLAVLG